MCPANATRILEATGQAHLVAHAQTLEPEVRDSFLVAAGQWPWGALRDAATGGALKTPPVLRPPVALRWRRQQAEGGLRPRLAELGNALLRSARVATMLLAGGQGSRLGHPGPKGTFVFGPEADRSLYRILAERVLAASWRVGHPIPLIVLTSPSTDAATQAAFGEADNFGLAQSQVRFVLQGTLPCVDEEGRALLAGPGELAQAPDGHGGALTALQRSGTLAWLLEQGIDVLTTFQVDNPLGRPLDPVMLGWMVERRAQIVTKAVAKSAPDERVGVYARDMTGRHRIVEYSELPEEGAEELTLGSIAVHAMQVRWLHDLLEGAYELPLHPARKELSAWTSTGVAQQDGIKLERFLFDVFPEAARLEVHEVRREWEFAPVKNASGVDSADSSRLLVDAELRRWHGALDLPPPAAPSLQPLVLDGAEIWQQAIP